MYWPVFRPTSFQTIFWTQNIFKRHTIYICLQILFSLLEVLKREMCIRCPNIWLFFFNEEQFEQYKQEYINLYKSGVSKKENKIELNKKN